MTSDTKPLSLKKSSHIFFTSLKMYRRRKSSLSSHSKENIKSLLDSLQDALLNKDKEKSSVFAKKLLEEKSSTLKKTFAEHFKDFVFSIVLALVVAIVIRQVWFEFYEIPTGSMRPTFKEQDRLVVSKDQFSINVPLLPKQLYFSPENVKRNGVVVFTGDGMDIPDSNTMYFYILPGKKQYIKRMIGKPGDTLYFYGGKIYGIDKQFNDISSELNIPSLKKIDHIPYISFEGKAMTGRTPFNGIYTPVFICQMNQPVAKMELSPTQKIIGEMLPTFSTGKYKQKIKHYGQLWGFRNYAMARLLTKDQYDEFTHSKTTPDDNANLYLELTHNPSLLSASLEKDFFGRLRPTIGTEKSYLPVSKENMQTLFDNLYTARFIVNKNGFAHRYSYQKNSQPPLYMPKLEGVPAGTYEFYYGTAYKISWQGISKALPKSHPIYEVNEERLLTLFNLGIELDTRYAPTVKNQPLIPSRYAYFNDHDLYVMGGKFLTQATPSLKKFVEDEHLKQTKAPAHIPYFPFIDYGPPVKENGKIDTDFIRNFGISVPEQHYLVLGDNYAMSADSRDFGFVPASKLRGVPKYIFWPFGKSFGKVNQISYPLFTLSRVIVWMLALIGFVLWFIIHRKIHRLPKDID